ncbi:MAG: hypothetical protein JST04_14230 [Bdellovibrionales bacterium]|nr:hypothetical protein [Bdellovibrionales bacterium]
MKRTLPAWGSFLALLILAGSPNASAGDPKSQVTVGLELVFRLTTIAAGQEESMETMRDVSTYFGDLADAIEKEIVGNRDLPITSFRRNGPRGDLIVELKGGKTLRFTQASTGFEVIVSEMSYGEYRVATPVIQRLAYDIPSAVPLKGGAKVSYVPSPSERGTITLQFDPSFPKVPETRTSATNLIIDLNNHLPVIAPELGIDQKDANSLRDQADEVARKYESWRKSAAEIVNKENATAIDLIPSFDDQVYSHAYTRKGVVEMNANSEQLVDIDLFGRDAKLEIRGYITPKDAKTAFGNATAATIEAKRSLRFSTMTKTPNLRPLLPSGIPPSQMKKMFLDFRSLVRCPEVVKLFQGEI